MTSEDNGSLCVEHDAAKHTLKDIKTYNRVNDIFLRWDFLLAFSFNEFVIGLAIHSKSLLNIAVWLNSFVLIHCQSTK